MPTRRRSVGRRTRMQASADRATESLVERLGTALKERRSALGLTQAEVGSRAGIAPSTEGAMERGDGSSMSMAVWVRAALAVDGDLRAYLEGLPGAERPRDHAHLRTQESILRLVAAGGWTGGGEVPVDSDLARSRSADVQLTRANEVALIEVFDWFDDVGAAWRSSDRKRAKVGASALARSTDDDPLPTVGLCWVVRRTQRNRQLVGEHENLFRSWLPAPGRDWLAALTDSAAPMPRAPGMLWVSLDGQKLTVPR